MNSILATSIEFANLGIKLNNVGKSISIFGVDIAYYGMIIATGMILGIIVTCAEAKRTGQDPNDYIDFAIYAIIFSVIGARLYYVIFSWDYYKKNPGQILNIRGGGLAIYGGIIAAIITCFVYTRIKKMSMPRVMDTAALGLILGQILGRWGNFFNREAFGGVASGKNPFAMKIYFDSHYSITQVPDSVREGMEKMFGKTLEQIGYIQVHPTFLYESCWNLVLLIILLIFRDKKKYNGEVFLWYIIGYGTGRFFIEGLRSDQLIMPVTGWPVSQVLSLILVIVGIAFAIYMRNKLKKDVDDTSEIEI